MAGEISTLGLQSPPTWQKSQYAASGKSKTSVGGGGGKRKSIDLSNVGAGGGSWGMTLGDGFPKDHALQICCILPHQSSCSTASWATICLAKLLFEKQALPN